MQNNTTTPATTTTFEAGQTYVMRWITDASARTLYTVVSRTAKFVVIEDADGNRTRAGVKTFEGVEIVHPHGRYSMAPTLKADRPIV